MSFPDFDIRKKELSEVFRGESTPETIRSFQGRLVDLIREHKNDPRLVTLFKEVLETAAEVESKEDLQSKLSSKDSSQDDAVQRLAFDVFFSEKMKKMLRSSIEAPASNDSEEKLRSMLSSEEAFGYRDRLPSEVVDAIRLIPEEELNRSSCSLMIRLFEGVEHEDERNDIMLEISNISKEGRVGVIEKAMPFLEGVADGWKRGKILRIIGKILPETSSFRVYRLIEMILKEKPDFFQKALPVLGAKNLFTDVGVLEAILYTPEKERENVIKHSFSLFRGISGEAGRSAIVSAVRDIPADQRDRIVEGIHPIVKEVKNGFDKVAVIKAIERIPEEQRAGVIEACKPFFEGISEGYEEIVKAVVKIPKERRSDVTKDFMPIFENFNGGYERAALLEMTWEIPSGQRIAFIKKIESLLGDMSWFDRNVICTAVGQIPVGKRAEAMEKMMSFLKGISLGYHRKGIIESIGKIPEEQVMDVIEKALPLLEGIPDGRGQEILIDLITDISSDRRAEAVKVADRCKSLTKEAVLQAWVWIPPGEHVQAWQTLLIQLDKIHSPLLQTKLLAVFHGAIENPGIRALFESRRFEELFPRAHSQVFRLLTACLWISGAVGESPDAVAVVLRSKEFKEVDRKKIVLSAFSTLLEAEVLLPEEKIRLLKKIFSEREIEAVPSLRKNLKATLEVESSIDPKAERVLIDTINKSLLLMETICNFGLFAELKTIEKSEDLAYLLERILKEMLNVGDVPGFSDRYLETFGSNRDPFALPVYAGKMRNLDREEAIEALRALKLYVEEVLTGALPASRYGEETSRHLSKVFFGRPELKRRWIEGKEIDGEAFFPSNEAAVVSQAFDSKGYLQQRVTDDQHISHEKVPYLAAFLKGSASNVPGLIEEIRKSKSEDQPLQQRFALLKLQEGLVLLLQSTNDRRHEIFLSKVEPFIETALFEENQFTSDLVGLGKMLAPQSKKNSFAGWKVVDTDDPQDLLLCGTEVEGSCQSIRGGPMNKCLLAYLLDGKNRLIAVKDDKGRIMGRSILRILWDETKQMPVLFKERVYVSAHADSKVKEAVDRMCLLRARELQLPLVVQSSSDAKFPAYPNVLKSFGSRSPFEYTDAGGGVTNGTFTVMGELVADFSSGGAP